MGVCDDGKEKGQVDGLIIKKGVVRACFTASIYQSHQSKSNQNRRMYHYYINKRKSICMPMLPIQKVRKYRMYVCCFSMESEEYYSYERSGHEHLEPPICARGFIS